MSTGPAIVVIGMGNPLRRDDGVGSRVARQIEALGPPGVEVRTHDGGDPGLMDAWEGVSAAVVVDAVSSGAPAGTIFRFDAGAGPLPAHLEPACSTHGFGLDNAVELARALDRLPGRLIVIGVEGSDFSRGGGLSGAVEGAVERAVEAVMKEIGRLATPGPPRRFHIGLEELKPSPAGKGEGAGKPLIPGQREMALPGPRRGAAEHA